MQFTKSQLVTPFNQTIHYIYPVQISSSSPASSIQSAHEPWLLAMNIYNNNKLCASECNNKTINLYPNGGFNYNLQLWNKMTYQCVTVAQFVTRSLARYSGPRYNFTILGYKKAIIGREQYYKWL